VEDDASIRELVVYTLQSTGFEAQGMSDAQSFYDALKVTLPELVILDIMLPGEDGLSILKHIRGSEKTKDIPVIVASAKGTEYAKVIGLDIGADDYIPKPFGMMELVSRVRAVLRRSALKNTSQQIAVGDIRLNTQNHMVFSDGKEVVLTLKEFELLRTMMENPGRVFTRDTLLGDIWGYGFDGETRTVDVHIRTLRQKLGDTGDQIETVRGVGYRIGGKR
jgi:two-component system alkaline phosphatase synthesis response regulator PhoP